MHSKYFYDKLIRYVGIFYKLAHKLHYFCRRNIYYAFNSHIHITYGIEIYANTSKTLLHKLHIVHNKLLRILQKQAPLTPIYHLYSTFNTLPIHVLYNQKILELVHCSIFHVCDLPEVYRNYFTVNKSVHSYDTRQSHYFGSAYSLHHYTKELFSILEVSCGILYHQFLRNACLKII